MKTNVLINVMVYIIVMRVYWNVSLIEIMVMSNKSKLLQWQVDLRKHWSTLVNGVILQDISSHLIEYNVLKPELWEDLKKRRIREKDRMDDFLLILMLNIIHNCYTFNNDTRNHVLFCVCIPLYMYFRGMHACMIMYVIVCLFVHVWTCVWTCVCGHVCAIMCANIISYTYSLQCIWARASTGSTFGVYGRFR